MASEVVGLLAQAMGSGPAGGKTDTARPLIPRVEGGEMLRMMGVRL